MTKNTQKRGSVLFGCYYVKKRRNKMKKYVYVLWFWQGYEEFFIIDVFLYKKDAVAHKKKIDENIRFSGYEIEKCELK